MRLEYPALNRAVREQQNLFNRAPERSGSQETLHWSKADSNRWSHLRGATLRRTVQADINDTAYNERVRAED
jgi:hypothetical protein